MNNNKYIPLTNKMVTGEAFHPGEFIKDEIDYRDMKQKGLAEKMGIAPNMLSELIHGKRNITPLLALKLETALDIDAMFWLKAQAMYEIDKIRLQYNNQLHKITLTKKKKDNFTSRSLQYA